jgi:hypothetical protein
VIELTLSQLKDKVTWETISVAPHLLVKPPRLRPVERSQVSIQQHLLSAQHKNPLRYGF